MLLGILVGLGGFATFVVLHWLLFHWRVLKAEFRNLVALLALTLVGALLVDFAAASLPLAPEILGHPVVRTMTTLLVFACCFVLYMPFYYVIATSLSVQTMILVDQAGPEGCPLAFLEDLFGSRNVLHRRLEIMISNGYLVRAGNHFRATAKGARISRVFSGLKRLWRLGAGG